MRPTRLELEGFASFRDPVTVDFADTELFVLSGPTGAGKSSIVDAMTFALYGTVPRYDDRRMVAPLISQGRQEARVRLDFTVGGQPWTAVRVVRRTKTGATTKEARLERWRDDDGSDTTTVAGTADELTQAVESLLGLRFDHFTSCIVLPQGAFQAFLHSRPKERQDLLVQLLDLDVYRQVGSAARDRATAAQQRADMLRRQLDADLADATDAAVDRARARVGELDALVAALQDAQPRLDEIRDEGRRLREAATTARDRAKALTEVRVPEGADALASALDDARRAAVDADEALEQAGAAVERAAEERDEAGDAAVLSRQAERLEERTRLDERLATASRRRDEADDALARAGERVAAADEAVERARRELDDARQHDLVATLVADHRAGDPCPVCARPLEEVPTADGERVRDAGTALEQAEQGRADADRARQAAASEHARAAAEHDGLVERAATLDQQLAASAEAGLPVDAAAVVAQLDRLRALDATVADARRAEQDARAADRAARQALQSAESAVKEAWNDFDRALHAVAPLGPPAIDRDDLVTAWDRLSSWASERGPQLVAEAEHAEAAVDATAGRWKDEVARQRAACGELDVVVAEGEMPRDAAVREAERARHRHDQLVERRARSAQVRDELARAQREQRVAHELGLHLKSSNFEKWLLNRALTRLVAGATTMLRDLSDGAYSLVLDESGGFAVVDHRNADEIRSARTLSGGETFLASLALALALSEHVADLAAQGAARLESLILDEGFGTLDTETLDVVATALEELGSRGRMVGVITHVGALAERLPVRYAVRKQAGTSTVERVVT